MVVFNLKIERKNERKKRGRSLSQEAVKSEPPTAGDKLHLLSKYWNLK